MNQPDIYIFYIDILNKCPQSVSTTPVMKVDNATPHAWKLTLCKYLNET